MAIPGVNRLCLTTALAVVLLAILLTGDFSGLFHGDVRAKPPEAAAYISAEGVEPEISPEPPAEMPALPIIETKILRLFRDFA